MPSILDNDLFLSAPTFTKEAGHKLSLDVADWEQDIMQLLHQEHPYVTKYAMRIAIRKSDSDSGTGIGALHLEDTVSVPILIDNFQLYPLDLFFKDGELEPLTKTALEAALQGHSLGTPVKPNRGEQGDVAISHVTLPPYDGKYAFANELPYSRKQVEGALDGAFTEQGLTYSAHANPYFRDSVHQYLTGAEEPDGMVKSASSKVEGELVKRASVTSHRDSGLYKVATDQGPITGMVADYSVTLGFSDPQARDIPMFVGFEKRAYAKIDPEGFVAEEPTEVPDMPEEDMRGQGIFFVVKEGSVIATDPLEILAKTSGGYYVRAANGTQKQLVKVASDEPRLEESDTTILLSDHWRFVPVDSKVHLVKKAAAEALIAPKADVKVRCVNNQFTVEGNFPEFSKLASDANSYEKTARCLGVYFDPGLVDEALEEARRIGDSFIKTALPIVKEASAKVTAPKVTKEDLVALTTAASLITPDICKVAKVEGDKARKTIDVMLGLNFLGEETLYKFIERIEDLEQAKQSLAQLLLATRLGLDLETRPLRTAMFALDTAVRDLKELRNSSNA